MEYEQYVPHERLSPFIKCYWSLESGADSAPHSRERVFPDGCVELLFHYGDLFTKFSATGRPQIQPRNFIHGQIKKFIELEATGKIGMLSIRFHASGLRPFVDFGVDAITGSLLPLAEVWPDGKLLENNMTHCQNNRQRIAFVEEFLLSKLNPGKNDQAIAECVRLITATGGIIAVEELSANLNMGTRQLERRFLASVGLSLKIFSRIIRFNNALQLIGKKDFSTFTSVAHHGGFYDQAHFIKDFRDLTGLNPRQYFSENLDMVKFFNL